MKTIRLMLLSLLALLGLTTTNSQAQNLTVGDIAFLLFDGDNGGGEGDDQFAFVALNNITAGTQIYFRDDEWTGSAFAGIGEGELLWTAPVGGVAAGTVVAFTTQNSLSVNVGNVTATIDVGINISGSGETVWAFQGTSNTPSTFLAAISSDTFADTISGTGLTVGTAYAVQLTGSIDHAQYSGPRSGESSFTNYASFIGNVTTYWTQASPSGVDLTANTTSFTTSAPSTSVTIDDVMIDEGDSGTQILTFTVSRTDNNGTFSVDYSTADSTANATEDYVVASGTLNFSASGNLTETIDITINGDTDIETDEVFFVNLGNLTNTVGTATLTDAQGDGVIATDDFASSITPTNDLSFTVKGNITMPSGAEITAFDPASQRLFVPPMSGCKWLTWAMPVRRHLSPPGT
ncbi:MAG: hypothetical protein HC901_03305 [Bdellovibrionaceae bacterium]|nr:hypothetical protein [Pseudobdellovibrionaceae bacterium]